MDVMEFSVNLFLNFYEQKQKQKQQQQQMRERTFEVGVTLAQMSTQFRNDTNK
jgi:hypothetical protein